MGKKVAFILLSVWLGVSSRAQSTDLLGSVSPKLRQFLTDHPVASRSLSNAVAEAFASRTVRLFYFYSDDDSVPRAFHYYSDESRVDIVIRENQQPCDEYISFIFEVLNSEGEKRFQQLSEMAKSGTISRADFAREIMKQEFCAVNKTKALVGDLKLSQQEMTQSYFYSRFVGCPGDFESFLSYKKKVSTNRDEVKELEQAYDSLRKVP